jgi:hypothetical protein
MNPSIRRLSIVALAVLAGTLSAQDRAISPAPTAFDGEWSFVRLAYRGYSGYGSSYTIDYPEAEYFLREGVNRLTRAETGSPQMLTPDDPDLMNYPWLYAVEVGRWYLDEYDADSLREYLLRGGFLMVDDFHGTNEWLIFEDSMKRVFPERPIVEIPDNDPLMSIVYDLDKSIQIPGVQFVNSGRTWEDASYTAPHWRGIYDDDNRLMVAINYNMDLGDAWEHANNPQYPEPMTGLAIRFAVNYVIYAMTH